MKRFCSKCRRVREFYPSVPRCCKECQRAASRENYVKNRKDIRKRQAVWREARSEEYNKLKDRPCTDCGVKYIRWVMEFDHLDPTKKTSDMSRMGMRTKPNKLLKEAAMCDVVCANCHRIREYKRWLAKQSS